jgi:hypothetical protein
VGERPEEPVLPDQTRDDTDAGWGESEVGDDDDRRLIEDLPPHHVDRD